MGTTKTHLVALAYLAIPCLAPVAQAQAADTGQQIATSGTDKGVPACASCHGAQGQGNAAGGFPRLAGQPAAYMVTQLKDYKSGKRKNAVMAGMAANLSEAEMTAVSQYYAKQTPPSDNKVEASSGTLNQGRQLAVNGDWSDEIPACVDCHGPGARGVSPHFPALAGQHAGYTQNQIKAWQNDKRPPGPGGLMKTIADRLESDQVKAVSAYLASLPATGKIPEKAQPDTAPASDDAESGYFQPPLQGDLPKKENGDAVRRGEKIFTATQEHAGQYLGGGLNCSNCHINKGRQANSAPMWAAWVLYPKYRGKNDKINTMADRIRGCFTYSENAQDSDKGHAPAGDSRIITDLQSYFHWVASNAPTGKEMKGQGYPALDYPDKDYDPERGAKVYAKHCAVCHGDDGQGTKGEGGHYVFPPLWGPDSFNWGAGMHRVNTAAAFIEANMPLSQGGSLNNQQAWDVAAYIDSRPRPQDPRFDGDLKETIKKYHSKREIDYYGETVNGHTLGAPGN